MFRNAFEILGFAVAGSLIVLVGAYVWLEFGRPVISPYEGYGFDGLGFVLYLFGPPIGGLLGVAVGVRRVLRRTRTP